ESRTLTGLPPGDFESPASAIPPLGPAAGVNLAPLRLARHPGLGRPQQRPNRSPVSDVTVCGGRLPHLVAARATTQCADAWNSPLDRRTESAHAARTILGPGTGRAGLSPAARRLVPRRRTHSGRSRRRRQPPPAPHSPRLRASATAPAPRLDSRPRTGLGRRRRCRPEVRRVPQLLCPGAPGRPRARHALPPLRRAGRCRVVRCRLARIRGAQRPTRLGHAGAGPGPRLESARDGVRPPGVDTRNSDGRAALGRPPVLRWGGGRLRSRPSPRSRRRRWLVLAPLALLLERSGDVALEPASLVLVARPLHR